MTNLLSLLQSKNFINQKDLKMIQHVAKVVKMLKRKEGMVVDEVEEEEEEDTTIVVVVVVITTEVGAEEVS